MFNYLFGNANNVLCDWSILWLCDKKRKKVKNGQMPKYKKVWNLSVSKSESNNLMRKTATKNRFISVERRIEA